MKKKSFYGTWTRHSSALWTCLTACRSKSYCSNDCTFIIRYVVKIMTDPSLCLHMFLFQVIQMVKGKAGMRLDADGFALFQIIKERGSRLTLWSHNPRCIIVTLGKKFWAQFVFRIQTLNLCNILCLFPCAQKNMLHRKLSWPTAFTNGKSLPG